MPSQMPLRSLFVPLLATRWEYKPIFWLFLFQFYDLELQTLIGFHRSWSDPSGPSLTWMNCILQLGYIKSKLMQWCKCLNTDLNVCISNELLRFTLIWGNSRLINTVTKQSEGTCWMKLVALCWLVTAHKLTFVGLSYWFWPFNLT